MGTEPEIEAPVVGIAGYLLTAEGSRRRGLAGEETSIFALNYFDRAAAFGMSPLAIPVGDESLCEAYCDVVDGLIFTGGTDVDPSFYGERPHPKLGATEPRRDAFELALARAAIRRRMPVLGICRGIQLLNVALGGTLVQDLPAGAGRERHGTGTPVPAFHDVVVLDGPLQALLGRRTKVNSLHHQAVLRLAAGLEVLARSRDGVIEAVAAAGLPLLAVQWHPEQLEPGDPAGEAPFRWLRDRLAERLRVPRATAR